MGGLIALIFTAHADADEKTRWWEMGDNTSDYACDVVS
jgi:hypothetical protein